MAVYAAHLTRAAGDAPSVFTVAAQQALADTVKPALARLAQYLSDVYPSLSSTLLVEWYDELYLLLDTAIQYHYLKHYAASFSESFYGLRRVPLTSVTEFDVSGRLPAALERGSLALLVLAPYCWGRVGRLVERWQEDREEGRLGKSPADRLKSMFCVIWRALMFARATCALALLARFVARGGPPTLPLTVLGLRLAYAPPVEPTEYGWKDVLRDLRAGRVSPVGVRAGASLLAASQYCAFLLLALRSAAPAHVSKAALPGPPPPTIERRGRPGECPVCRQPWRVPTALAVSGYIFCYSCISRHVRARAACPVTRCPAGLQGLIRLYI